MAMLPRYQRSGLMAAKPKQMDFANLREGIRQTQAISDVVGQMSDFVYKKAAATAARKGETAVQEQGAQTVLGRIAEGGGPSTIAEKSAYALGSRIASAEITTDAEIEISNILDQAQNSLAPLSAVRQQLADVADGYSAAMSNIDPGQAAVLRTNLMGSGDKAVQRYAEWFSAKQVAVAKARRVQSRSVNYDAVLGGAILPGAHSDSIFIDVQTRANVMLETGADPVAVQGWIDSTTAAALRENLFARFNRGSLDAQAEIISRLKEKPPEGMSLEQSFSLSRTLSSAHDRGLKVVDSQFSGLVKLANNAAEIQAAGGVINQETFDQLDTLSRSVMKHRPEAPAIVAELRRDSDYINSVREMTIPELETELASVKGGVPGMGGEGLDTATEIKMRDIVAGTLRIADQVQRAADAETDQKIKAEIQVPLSEIQTALDVITLQTQSGNIESAALALAVKTINQNLDKIPEGYLPNGSDVTIATALALADELTSAYGFRPEELSDRLAGLKSGVIPGSDDPNLSDIELIKISTKRGALVQSRINAQNKAVASGDALLWAAAQGITYTTVGPYGERVVNKLGAPLDFNDNLPGSIATRLEHKRIAEYIYNSSVNILTSNEVAGLKNILTDGNVSVQAMVLEGIVQAAGPEASLEIFNMISKDAPVMAYIGGLMNEGNTSAAKLAIRGITLENPQAFSNQFGGGINVEFSASVGIAYSTMPTTGNAVFEVAKNIYKAKVTDLGKQSDPDLNRNIWKQSVADAISPYKFGEANGQVTILPIGVSEEDMNNWLNTPVDIQSFIADPNDFARPISTKNFEKSNWVPVLVGRDQYILRRYVNSAYGFLDLVFNDGQDEVVVFDFSRLGGEEERDSAQVIEQPLASGVSSMSDNVDADRAYQTPNTIEPSRSDLPQSNVPKGMSELRYRNYLRNLNINLSESEFKGNYMAYKNSQMNEGE
tara:strand:+ start:11983 stop:14829 length:2847 start_codon:yes stop_codon:yes gene_type:complete